MSRLDFVQNFANLFKIDITPEEATPTWALIAAGINDVSWNGNENVTDDNYYDGGGNATTEVSGGKPTATFSGHRRVGDPAQDFIASILVKYGKQRHTSFEWVQPDGTVLSGDCTISNIVVQGGDPNAKGTFSCDISLNGAPLFTAGSANAYPTGVALTAPSLRVNNSAQLSPTITPSGASASVVYIVEDETKCKIDPNGKIFGLSTGSTYIVCRSAVRPSVYARVQVTVSS